MNLQSRKECIRAWNVASFTWNVTDVLLNEVVYDNVTSVYPLKLYLDPREQKL